jgi:hypothetical protein
MSTRVLGEFMVDRRPTPIDHWRIGRLLRYPRCCVARFVWDRFTGQLSATKRGGTVHGYVPCGIFHHKDFE